MAPNYAPHFPWVIPVRSGQSLLTTSPALLLAFRAKRNLSLWAAVILCMIAPLLVYANGTLQLGARYWLIVLPFLLVLMAQSPMDRLAKVLVGMSIGLMTYWMWAIRKYPL